MKKFNFYNLIITFGFILISFSFALAQAPTPISDEDNPPPPRQQRPNLMRELNLTSTQIQQIRQLNQQRKPINQEAQARLREANRALDEAIYSDSENDVEIQARIKAVHAAQLETIKNRVLTERAIRRILTPQQLSRFRELRGRFMNNNPENPPANRRQRLKNLPNKMRPKPSQSRIQ